MLLCTDHQVSFGDDWADDNTDRSVSLARPSHLAKVSVEMLRVSQGHPRRSELVARFRSMSSRSGIHRWIDEPSGGIRVERNGDEMILEWDHDGAVLGFTFAADDRDTGYYLVLDNGGVEGAVPKSESGTADKLDAEFLLYLIHTMTA